MPFDLGAHWVSVADARPARNPRYTLGRESGYRFYRDRDEYRIFTHQQEATDSEANDLWAAYDVVRSSIGTAGDRGRDVSAASAAADNGPWQNTAEFIMGPWSMVHGQGS